MVGASRSSASTRSTAVRKRSSPVTEARSLRVSRVPEANRSSSERVPNSAREMRSFGVLARRVLRWIWL